jgi:hypothetical protein
MTTDNIRELPHRSELPENLVEIKPEPFQMCRHESILLNAHDRSIECKKCGAVLDAFNYLLHEGVNIQRAWDNHRQVRRQIDTLLERVTKLAREEKRLKASIRRLQDKAGTAFSPRGAL